MVILPTQSVGKNLSTNSIVPARPIYSFIFHDLVFTLQWKPACFFSSLLSKTPWPVRCFPSTLQWNIDVKSLESWVPHLSWWYHKAAINSVTGNQTYHRHIIGYEDITESTCLNINRAFPGGWPLVDSQRSLQSPFTSPLGLPHPSCSFHFSLRSAQDSFLFFLFFCSDGIVSMQMFWIFA